MLSPDAQMIDRRILQEARTLARRGFQVTVLSGFECKEPDAYAADGYVVKRFRYDWSDSRRKALRDRLGPALARLVWPPLRLANRLRGGPTAFEAFVLNKVLEHDFDVVHVHDYPMLATGAAVARLRGAKLVYDSHEFYSGQSSLPPDTQKKYLATENRLIRHCDAVITVNPYIANMFARAHGIPEPAVILNAAEVSAPDCSGVDRREQRLALRLPPDDFLILYQGWISAERNLEPMIEGMVSQPLGSTLVVVGYGDHLAALKDLAASCGASDRILFYGRVESEDLPSLTRLCDLGVIPYRAVDEMHRYCSPNKLFEFIAAGLPIVASNLPYLRDVIEGYGIGWLADLDTREGFAAALQRVTQDVPALAQARAALPKAAASLNWEIEGNKLLEIYHGLEIASATVSPH